MTNIHGGGQPQRGSVQGGLEAGHAMVPYAGNPNAIGSLESGNGQGGLHAGHTMVPYAGNPNAAGNAMMLYDGSATQVQPTNSSQSAASFQKPPDVQRKGRQNLGKRLQKGWNKDNVMKGLDITIHDYSKRHGGRQVLAKEKGVAAQGPRSQELGILDKVVKETAEGAKMIPAEEVLSKTLRAGYREYIDYALDEVERFADSDVTGSAPQFDWKIVGDAFDVPALRRSRAENAVSGGSQDVVCTHQHSNMFKMDFIRDCCRKADGGNPALALRPASVTDAADKESSITEEGSDTEQLLEELFSPGAPDLGQRVARPWRPEYAGPWASEYTLV